MGRPRQAVVESMAATEFARVMGRGRGPLPATRAGRLDLDQQNVRNGLGRLVLTLIKLLHELLEKQALRRVESGTLTENQIERLGITLMRQSQEIDRLREEFGLREEDLNLDLGPLGRLF